MWPYRGQSVDVSVDGGDGGSASADGVRELSAEQLQACIRCHPGTEDGTMGFFVCAFVRDVGMRTAAVGNRFDDGVMNMVEKEEEEEKEEWEGFSDK